MNALDFDEPPTNTGSFADEVERRSGQRIRDCNQCGKCTLSCPIAFTVKEVPGRIMFLIKNGLEAEVLMSPALWLCNSCSNCSDACSKGIDVFKVMELLRTICREAWHPSMGPSFIRNLLMKIGTEAESNRDTLAAPHGKISLSSKKAREKQRDKAVFNISFGKGRR